MVRIWDRKSNPSIDPNLANNERALRVNLRCENDVLALLHFSARAQTQLYSGVDATLEMSVTIANYGCDL